MERSGERIPVGRIRGKDSTDACFAYSDAWLCDPAAAPVSLSLPLQEAPFTPAQTKAYFDGLLPEGFTRSTVAQWMHVDDGDYLSILHGLGRECLGALCITEENEEPQTSYEKITREQVRELAAEGASKSAEIVTSTHLRWLKKHRRVTYTNLVTTGKLPSYLADIDREAKEMFSLVTAQYAAAEGVTEKLKADDQMAWVGRMNNIRERVEEVVLRELVYS